MKTKTNFRSKQKKNNCIKARLRSKIFLNEKDENNQKLSKKKYFTVVIVEPKKINSC